MWYFQMADCIAIEESHMSARDLEKAAMRGEPSYIWRSGQKRRLRMIQDHAGRHACGWVLDNGCGVGAYLEHLGTQSQHAFGLEYDLERAFEAGALVNTVACAAGEHLPYPSNAFDLVLSHEVLEHVKDDRQSVEEIVRVLRMPDPQAGQPGGRLVLFVPNRGYPFETHGVYWRGHYHFGNIPFINYLPRRLRDRLAPHVRIYTARDLEYLFNGLPLRPITKTIIFGGYDNIIARWPRFGQAIRGFLHLLEHTPLRFFGLSHFWVLEKTSD